jgi:hypothetical protein
VRGKAAVLCSEQQRRESSAELSGACFVARAAAGVALSRVKDVGGQVLAQVRGRALGVCSRLSSL